LDLKTHPSAAAAYHSASYERLEYLGDGILDFKVVSYLFNAYPTLPPGGLSLLKVLSIIMFFL
jgi:endoribonuclease Dicer